MCCSYIAGGKEVADGRAELLEGRTMDDGRRRVVEGEKGCLGKANWVWAWKIREILSTRGGMQLRLSYYQLEDAIQYNDRNRGFESTSMAVSLCEVSCID